MRPRVPDPAWATRARRGRSAALTPVALLTAALIAVAAACEHQRSTGPGALGTPGGSVTIKDDPSTPAWRAIGVDPYNSCATTTDGRVYCWGFTIVTQCTDNPPACAIDSVPTRLLTALSFDTVGSGGGGGYHCGITPMREADCWGEQPLWSLGDGQTMTSATPVRVAIGEPIAAIAIGFLHACALTTQGAAYCWGDAALGNGDTTPAGSRTPRPVATQLRFTTLSAGTTQTCGIATDSTAWCWGSGFGTLGVGSLDSSCTYSPSCLVARTPVEVQGGLRWLSISAGNAFTCGIAIDHRAYCWGEVRIYGDPNPLYGVLGAGDFVSSKSPVPVVGGLTFRSIVTGTRHACGITLDNVAYCWGDNATAELGTGVAGGKSATPQRVVGGLRWQQLALGDVSCGITVNANLYCWGSDRAGALGDGEVSFTLHAIPTRVTTPTG